MSELLKVIQAEKAAVDAAEAARKAAYDAARAAEHAKAEALRSKLADLEAIEVRYRGDHRVKEFPWSRIRVAIEYGGNVSIYFARHIQRTYSDSAVISESQERLSIEVAKEGYQRTYGDVDCSLKDRTPYTPDQILEHIVKWIARALEAREAKTEKRGGK